MDSRFPAGTLIAVVAAVALFGAAEGASATLPCEDLGGHTFAGAGDRDGFLSFSKGGQMIWYAEGGAVFPGLWRCADGTARVRLVDSPPEMAEDTLVLAEGRLTWNDIGFTLADDPPAVAQRDEEAYDPAQDRCENLVGATYEIRSLEGLPGSTEPGSPRRPYLQLVSAGRGMWVSARGEKQSVGWHCDDRGLSVAFSGKPVLLERDAGGFRFGRAPVRRFRPRGTAPTLAPLDCASLKGRAFEIGDHAPRRDAFESADPGPRPPSLTFSADGASVDWVDDRLVRRTLACTCDESGVVVEVAGSPSRMTFDGAGMRWLAQPVRPVAPPAP